MSSLKLFPFSQLFDLSSGYVLDFSNTSFQVFINDSVGIDIYDSKYALDSGSKAKRLKAIIQLETDHTVYKLMSDLLKHWNTHYSEAAVESKRKYYADCLVELDRIKPYGTQPLEILKNISMPEDNTVQELVHSINTSIAAGRYNSALDRLHTFCIKYFRNKCQTVGIDISNKTLHSLVGEFINNRGNELSSTTVIIIKSSISVFERLNNTRNNESLAHDNELLNNLEARVISFWVINTLEFFDSLPSIN